MDYQIGARHKALPFNGYSLTCSLERSRGMSLVYLFLCIPFVLALYFYFLVCMLSFQCMYTYRQRHDVISLLCSDKPNAASTVTSMSQFPDYYKLLNIIPTATQEEVRQAYRKESLKLVPCTLPHISVSNSLSPGPTPIDLPMRPLPRSKLQPSVFRCNSHLSVGNGALTRNTRR